MTNRDLRGELRYIWNRKNAATVNQFNELVKIERKILDEKQKKEEKEMLAKAVAALACLLEKY